MTASSDNPTLHDFQYAERRSAPFFTAYRTSSGISTLGDERARLGHEVDLGVGRESDGIFARWDWDGSALTVENDRYGIYPLFYSTWGNEIRVSPSLRYVLGGSFPKTLDFPAMAVFQRLGVFLANDTPFEHVRLLAPGARLIWSADGVTLDSRFSKEVPASPSARNFDEAVEQYAALFSQAIRRRVSPFGSFDLALSGGRDSRHIFLELLAQGRGPERTVTVQGYPPIDDEDRLIARELASIAGQRHDEVNYPSSYLQATLQDIALTEFSASGHTWLNALAGYFSHRGTRCVFDGLAGDVLSAGHTITESKRLLLDSGKLSELADTLLNQSGNETFLQRCFQPDFLKHTPRSLAVERLVEELKNHRGAVNPLLSFVFWNRTRRNISLGPYGLLRDVPVVFCPYLDHDIFDFFMKLDPAYAGQGLHDETIRRSYPDFARVPYRATAARKPGRRELHCYYRSAARETLIYLMKNPKLMRSRLVRTGRLAFMLLRSSASRKPGKLWYLHPLIHRIKMEDAAGLIDGL